jgi:WD40 repeat protein/tRNA A-37 threonylcarbamoyl transferase component Bud32
LLSLVGVGGMGVVYKARDLGLRRTVAIKVLRGTALADAEARERFQAEAEAVARLQHPNIIQVFEVGTVQSLPGELHPSPFISLEFIEGGSLSRLTDAPQPPREAARLVEKLARAAHAAHCFGVVHRDLKPANVLLTGDGEPKIADFGVAKQLGAEDAASRCLTQAGTTVGTPEYMAPEQVGGEEPSPSMDVYALGVILYQLLTARVPFQGASAMDTMYLVRYQEPVSPRRLRPDLPRDLETICLKCLAKAPGRRYATAEALAEDLARWAEGRTIHARPVGAVERTVRWARRNPTVAALSGAVVVVALAGLSGVVWKWREAETQAEAAHAAAAEARERARAERWERYRADIGAASSALQLHNAGAARRALESSPEEYRNWEWRYFAGQLDTSQETLAGDGAPVHWVVITPGAGTVFTVADDDVARVWDLTRRREVARFPGMPGMGRSLLGPDGETLRVAPPPPDTDRIILRDARTGRTRAVIRTDAERIATVHFSPDSTRLATGSTDGTVRVWDAATGKEVLSFKAHETTAAALAFSHDGSQIATTGVWDRTARVWDARTGRPLLTLAGHDWNTDAVFFSPGGDRILTQSGFPANRMRLWESSTGRSVAELTGHANAIKDHAFSPDGSRLASASMDQTVRLWDGRTGKLVAVLRGHTGWVNHVAFSPDGTRLVSASQDKTLRLWDAATGEPLGVLLGHGAEVLKVAYAGDGATIVSGSRDATIRLWDARKAESGNTLRGHTNFVYSVAFHPDGNRFASAAWDGTIRVWDPATGRQSALLDYGEKTIVSSVAFHPGGKLLASLGRDDAVRLWDVETGREVHRWSLPSKHWQDSRLAFSPRGDLLAAGGKDHGVRLWDVNTRQEVAVLRGHEDTVRDVAFSPDGRWLATAGEVGDRTVRVWDVERRECVKVLRGHGERVYCLAFNHAGTLLASGSNDGTARLWDTETWAEAPAPVLKHGTNVYGLAFTPDGTRLASACADNTIRFWDVTTRLEVAELRGHTDYVHSLAFSPDGTRMVSASGDTTVRVWNAPLPRPGKR